MRLQSLSFATALVTLITVLTNTLHVSAQGKSWCGKPYIPRKQARNIIPGGLEFYKRAAPANTTGSPSATIVLPPTKDPIPKVPDLNRGYAAMVRIQPYLNTDEKGSLVVNAPAGAVSVQAVLDDGTEVLPKTQITAKDMAIEVPFSIAKITPKLTAYILKVNFFTGNNASPAFSTLAKLYRLPAGPKTVKIDRLTGATFTSQGTPIFPIGPYVDFGWLGAGDISANIQKLKSYGFNIINPDPTYTDLGLVDKVFQAMDQIGGIYAQLSFRYSLTQVDSVVAQVNRFKNYSSLLTWYTADEPDGEQWTDSSAELTLYNAIKQADPYHPVALVLNCEHTAAFYADTTDILATDVYPVGVDVSHCTETNDVCGCDNCLGSATLDIPKRTDAFMKDLTLIGRQSMNQWMVLQAFSDPPTWWSRMPTVAEFRVMSYISIVYGYKSIMFWKYPFVPDESLKDQITTISKEAIGLSPYILQYQQLPSSHVTFGTGKNFFSGVWTSPDSKTVLIIVVNGNSDKASSQFSLTVKDLTNLDTISGDATRDTAGKSKVDLKNGVLAGELVGYEVGIYTLGAAPPAINTNEGGDSNSGVGGNNSNGSGSGSTKSDASSISKSTLALAFGMTVGLLAFL